MASLPVHLTLDEFMSEYGGENGYEYWFGEAVRKGMGTKKHNWLADILKQLFRECGYEATGETDLCVDPNWRPRPDVMADAHIEDPYAIHPVQIVVEILSPDDRMSRVYRKCRNYVRIGIPRIFVFDPESKDSWEWSRATDNLERISELTNINGKNILISELWRRFDAPVILN